MARAFLHIGHSKTGSTALQMAFSASRQRLAGHGIQYPAETDPVGRIDLDRYNPGGNAMIPRVRPFGEGLSAIMSKIRLVPDQHLFLSGELIYHHMEHADILPDLRSVLGSYGFDDIRLLLFIRDPLPMHVSSWQQQLRSKGIIEALSVDPDQVTHGPRALLRILDEIEATEGVSLTVHSYDRPAAPLIDLVETWLELPKTTLGQPPGRVNRSFTRSEAKLVLRVNALLGSRSALGQKLMHRVPDPEPDPIGLQADALDKLTKALADPLAAVNARLPAHAQLQPGAVPVASWDDPARFNADQLEVIAEALVHGPPHFAPASSAPAPARSAPAPARRRPSLLRRALRPFDMRRWVRWARRALGGSERDMN